jgi:choline-sulfatase
MERMTRTTAKQTPNILIVICDQLSATALRAYGNTYARTPHIDGLMAGGARVENAYCAFPLCMPTRAAFWTGRHPHAVGVLSNGLKFPVGQVADDVPTLGSVFSAAGYRTVHFGKTHDAGSLRGFEVMPTRRTMDRDHPDFEIAHEGVIDADTRAQTVAFLRDYASGAGPFVAVADLQNPHNICGWIGRHKDVRQYPPTDDLPDLPANLFIDDLHKRPLPVQYICCAHNRQAMIAEWNEDGIRHYLKAYHEYLAQADAEIGRILAALNTREDADNTLVVFMADHGDAMCGRWMATKHTSFYDETTRIPLAFSGPVIRGRGRVVSGPVSQLDLLPTLCDYAGLDVPAGLHGRSLMPWLRGERADTPHAYVIGEWHTEWGYTIEPGRMVRSPRYKYTRYLEGDGEELYDLQTDPGETRTLSDDRAYAGILAEHRALLEDHLIRTEDPFLAMEWKADKRWRSHRPGYRRHRGPAAPMLA